MPGFVGAYYYCYYYYYYYYYYLVYSYSYWSNIFTTGNVLDHNLKSVVPTLTETQCPNPSLRAHSQPSKAPSGLVRYAGAGDEAMPNPAKTPGQTLRRS